MNEVYKIKEEEDIGNFRSLFARDRDRILYSKDFLRLKGKTQIFIEGYDDYLRNRLTHTLEVSHIANKISKCLELNLDLTNAIAFGHDIGHTPFGHAGERVLNSIMNGCYKINNTSFFPIENNRGFKHNWHGIRVIRDLNKKYTGESGLEISPYTEWGVLNHTGLNNKPCKKLITPTTCGNNFEKSESCKCASGYSIDFYEYLYDDINKLEYLSLEALVVEKSDEIAQRHHDLEDGLISKLIKAEDIIDFFPKKDSSLFKKLNDEEKTIIEIIATGEETKLAPILKKLTHLLISLYNKDLITNSQKNLDGYKEKYQLTKEGEFYEHKLSNKANKEEIKALIDFSPELKKIDAKLKIFLKSTILNSFMAQSMDSKAEYIILKLVDAYIERPQYLPKNTITAILERLLVLQPETIKYEEIVDVHEFIAEKHFKKLKNPLYQNYFLRGVCDFIAGMTDDFAYKQFNLIYGTEKIKNNVFQNV